SRWRPAVPFGLEGVPGRRSLAAHGAFEHVGAASPLDLTGVALHRDRIPRWNGRDVSVVLPPVPLNVRAHLSPFGAVPAGNPVLTARADSPRRLRPLGSVAHAIPRAALTTQFGRLHRLGGWPG